MSGFVQYVGKLLDSVAVIVLHLSRLQYCRLVEELSMQGKSGLQHDGG